MANNTVQKTIRINAQPEEVWQALTDPSIIKQYFYGTNVEANWTPGSAIKFTGEWKGQTYEDKGTVLKAESNKLLSYSYWSSMSGIPDKPENYVTVSFRLKPEGEGTTLTLTQETGTGTEAQKAYANSGDNWNDVLQQMKQLLEKEYHH